MSQPFSGAREQGQHAGPRARASQKRKRRPRKCARAQAVNSQLSGATVKDNKWAPQTTNRFHKQQTTPKNKPAPTIAQPRTMPRTTMPRTPRPHLNTETRICWLEDFIRHARNAASASQPYRLHYPILFSAMAGFARHGRDGSFCEHDSALCTAPTAAPSKRMSSVWRPPPPAHRHSWVA